MEIEKFGKKLETFIDEFDEKLELDENLVISVNILNEEGYAEWKALFQAYKELKEDENAFEHLNKFYYFTTDSMMKIFTFRRNDDREEFLSWVKNAY